MRRRLHSLRRNICSLVLLIMPGVTMASVLPTGPTYDVTLTDMQENLTNGQANFDVVGPGISLYATAIDRDLRFDGRFYQVSFDPQPFSIVLVLSGSSNAFAQGTVNGVTYSAADPLSLYLGGPSVTTSPFSFPSSGAPNYTFNTDPLITLSAVSGQGFDYACTPLCANPTSIPFSLNFVPSAGTASVQFSGPDTSDTGPAATFYPESFSFQASPVPEPAAYGSLILGLLSLYTFAQFKGCSDRKKGNR